jgi:alkylhydroperoxidase family enzyme
LARQMGLTEAALQKAVFEGDTADLDEKTRLALEYARRLVEERETVDEAFYERLRKVFDEAELVELGVFAALCIGFDTLISTWDLSPGVCTIE